MAENIEKKVADTILQREEQVIIGNKTYYTAPPSIATLILVSEAVSRLPRLDGDNLMGDTLAKAKDCRPLGEIVALFILGAKAARETKSVTEKQRRTYLWGLIKRTATVTREVSRMDALADELLEALTPKELNLLTARLLQRMQIADFFGLTTFLTGVSLTRPTKVVESEN